MSERAKFIAVVLLSLGLGVAGMFCPDVFVRSIGEALFIAAFLAVTVDLFVKDRLAKDVSRDVMAATLGYHVPREISDEIREIASFKAIRRNVDLVYRLSPYDASADYVWADSDLEFEVENLTDTPQPFRHVIWVEKPVRYSGVLEQVLYAKASGLGGGQDYELKNGEISQTDVSGQHAVEWFRAVDIPARSKAKFWSKSRQILPVEHVETFQLIQPSIGAKVRVFAEANLSISTEVNFAHRSNERTQKAGGNTWQLDVGFPPYSTITIEWRKRSASIPTGPSQVKNPPQPTENAKDKAGV